MRREWIGVSMKGPGLWHVQRYFNCESLVFSLSFSRHFTCHQLPPPWPWQVQQRWPGQRLQSRKQAHLQPVSPRLPPPLPQQHWWLRRECWSKGSSSWPLKLRRGRLVLSFLAAFQSLEFLLSLGLQEFFTRDRKSEFWVSKMSLTVHHAASAFHDYTYCILFHRIRFLRYCLPETRTMTSTTMTTTGQYVGATLFLDTLSIVWGIVAILFAA